jgi:hypothetical protein
MSELWDGLAAEVEALLKSEIEDFKDEVKAEAEPFIKDKAVMIAKMTWKSKNGATESERNAAVKNLEHLAAQVQGEVIRLQLATTKRALDLLGKVLSVVASTILRVAVPVLGGGS